MKTVIALCLVGTSAYAGGLAVGEQNAVSAATGGAGTARDDDPGAAWHDPAALADGGGLRVGLSMAFAHPALSAHAMDGSWSTDNAATWQTPPHLDASFAQDRWAAGLAVGVPFGGGVTWPAMWPGSVEAIETQLQDIRIAPFGAYSFGALRVSAGIHADFGRLQIGRGLDFIDTQGNVKMDLTGHGYGVDASAYWAARPDLGIGLVYRSRTQLDFSGPANFTAPPAFSDKTPDQTAKTSMTMPDQVVLGARWHRDRLATILDVEYTRWSVDDKTVVTFADPATPHAVQDQQWTNTFAVRGGAEYAFGALVARAGAYYDQTPVPADHLLPATPDGTRLGLTAGASYTVSPAWSADAFVEQMWVLRRETTSMVTMPATSGGTALVLGAGVLYTPL